MLHKTGKVLCWALIFSGLYMLAGCSEKVSKITSKANWNFSAPSALDIDSSNHLFCAELFTSWIWKIDLNQEDRKYTLQFFSDFLYFSPWGIAVARLATKDILFSTGTFFDEPTLLALSIVNQAVPSPLSPSVRLASTTTGALEGPIAVDSLTLNPQAGTVRVFVIDESPLEDDETIFAGIKVFNFNYYQSNQQLSVFEEQYTISSPQSPACAEAFSSPFGLAVDPAENVLYVVDNGANKLFRFSGINGPAPVCDGEISTWGADPADSFDSPKGVAVLSGQTPSTDNIIYVADADNRRIVAMKWNGSTFSHHESISVFFQGKPFDLAIDTDGALWGSFPKTEITINRVRLIKAP